MPADSGDQKIAIVCQECGASKEVNPTTKGNPRTPKGWHRLNEAFTCNTCWAKSWCRRAITIPAAELLDDATWSEFNATHRKMTTLVRHASNLAFRLLFAAEPAHVPGEKLAKSPNPYLYPQLREAYPDLPSETVTVIEHQCKLKYNALRFNMIVRGTASLPSCRRDPPYPIRGQSWKGAVQPVPTTKEGTQPDECPIVNFPMGGRRWRLRLRGGGRYKRQLAAFAQLTEHKDELAGQVDIIRRDSHLLVKVAGWFPKKGAQPRSGTLRVRTSEEELLLALNTKDKKLWAINADQLKRWVAEHRVQLHRWAEDQKMEERPDASFQSRRTAAVVKQRNRVNTAIQQFAFQVVAYADRRNFAEIQYDDTIKTYVDNLPWFAIKQRLETLCNERGILYTYVGSEEPEESPGDSQLEE